MQPVAIPVAVPAAPQPVVSELVPAPEPEEVFARLWGRPHCLFLDSAMRHPELGRYSYLAADPFAFLQVPANCGDALVQLSQIIQGMFASTAPELPPFQGGVAGLFGYELARGLEDVPRAAIDEFQVPALAVGLYDVVVAFDHHQGRAWIVSQGLPETGLDARTARAKARLSEAISWLSPAAEPRGSIQPGERQADIQHALIKQEDLATCFRVPGPEGLVSNFSSRGYCQAVQRAIDYIYEGDVFQVNLSQRLLFPAREDSVSLYQRLRRQNAATFSSYFDLGDFQICSTSPERFVQVRGRKVEARPIKGTCPRTARPEADLFAANGLQQSEKDRAENIMIVDLPPGTGDIQLTIAQQVPLAGAVIVSTPQDIALLDARKGLNMFRKVDVPVYGIIENMSYFLCPHCNERSEIFSHGGVLRVAEALGTDFLGEIPLSTDIRETSDSGRPIVVSDPGNEHAKTYTAIAEKIWEKTGTEAVQAPKIVVQ